MKNKIICELEQKVEMMIQDKNYYINSNKGSEKQVYAWKYAREDLEIILKMIKALDSE